jgi:phosphoribosylanthranilate isomerase
MALKCRVKVGSISNLSDARYCAGMGVDLLGFQVNKERADYVSPEKFNEIKGWISGPSLALEVSPITQDNFNELLSTYEFEFLETDLQSALELNTGNIQLIVKLDENSTRDINQLNSINNLAYLLAPESMLNDIRALNTNHKILVASTGKAENDIKLSSNENTAGLALKGSLESKPGFKDYDHLADVLEALEVD